MPARIDLDPEEIRRLYQDEGLLQREIAVKLDCSVGLIQRHMKEHNIPRTRNLKLNLDPELIRKLYWDENLTLKETASRLGCHRLILLEYMTDYNIPRRRGGKVTVKISPEELRELYQDKNLSMYEIAKFFNVSQGSVLRKMIAYDIPRDRLPPKGTGKGFRGYGWRRIKLEILKRDNHTCQVNKCQTGEKVSVHHIIPWKISGDNQPDNLITLCKTHHTEAEYVLPWLIISAMSDQRQEIKELAQSMIKNWKLHSKEVKLQ